MNKDSQINFVLQCLKKHKRVTSFEMFKYGITRLSAIIYNLRHTHQYNILTYKEKSKNGTYFAVYYLDEDFKNE